MNTNHHNPKLLRELGTAMTDFVIRLAEITVPGEEMDDVLRRSATAKYREVVERAARQNVEHSLAWHTLAVWTEDGKERIGFFARALECGRRESTANPPKTAKEKWSYIHNEADSLFEIGRIHFHEGAPEAARRFLMEALPLARQADALRSGVGISDDRLEGKIAELLLQLPDEEESPNMGG